MIYSVDTEKLEENTGYVFNNKEYLKLSLTHPSWSGEMKKTRIESNQRLEFLGDAVLELTVSEYLYKAHPQIEEGELTRLRSSLVFEAALCVCAKKICLGDFILLGKGEDQSGGREKPSILSDTFEALIGAIYLDGGFSAAQKFINDHVISSLEEKKLLKDDKSALQEYLQKGGNIDIKYETREEFSGSDRVFVTSLYINEEYVSEGTGRSKKAAEQDAAGKALKEFVFKKH